MKNYLLSILCIATLNSYAQNTLNPSSTIENVTVYLNGAEVTRTALISLKPGENVISCEGLAQSVNAKSINVKGNDNFLIKSVKHQQNFEENQTANQEVLNIEDELKEVDFTLQTRYRLQSVYNEEKALLFENRSIKGESEILLVEDLKEMAAFYREHLEELEYKLLELDLEIKDLTRKKSELQQKLNKSRNFSNKFSSQLEIVLLSEKAINTKLQFSYIVNNAAWYATYDVRTSELNEPVQLSYKANISQTTGIDWSNVNLTLSTGNPMVNGDKPIIEPWYLSEYNAAETYGWYKDNQRKQENQRGREKEEEEYELRGMMAYGNADGIGEYSFGSPISAPIEALVNTEFPISIKYDIPSNGESYEVEIQRNDLDSDYSYYAAPGLDKDAFLLARLYNWTELNLLPGDANIYYQNAYVGNSFLDPYSTEDTLDISLGKDKNIIINREKLEDFCKTNTFGGNKKTTRAYKITIKNNKSSSVSLKLEDQVPVSKQNNVSVEVENLSGGVLNEDTGIITWELELAPGETKELNFQYLVKYPKKIKLARL